MRGIFMISVIFFMIFFCKTNANGSFEFLKKLSKRTANFKQQIGKVNFYLIFLFFSFFSNS